MTQYWKITETNSKQMVSPPISILFFSACFSNRKCSTSLSCVYDSPLLLRFGSPFQSSSYSGRLSRQKGIAFPPKTLPLYHICTFTTPFSTNTTGTIIQPKANHIVPPQRSPAPPPRAMQNLLDTKLLPSLNVRPMRTSS